MQTIIINATLTTEQPIAIKLPDQEGHPTMTRGLDSDGQPQRTAYIPATTFRGKIRRLAVLPLMQAAAKNNKPWTLYQVYEAMLGQDAASETKEEIDLVALKKRRADNHTIDLFGAGLNLNSRLFVGHFMPHVNVQPETFHGVRKDLDSDPDVLDLMDPSEVDGFVNRSRNNSKRATADAQIKVLNKALRKAEKAGEDISALTAQLTAATKQRDELEAALGDIKNSTKTLTQYEALPAGIALKSRIRIHKATPKDLNVLLSALDLFSRTPVLGGQTARGCGEVSGSFEIRNADGDILGIVRVGGYNASQCQWTGHGEAFLKKST
jgi:CRISPR type IV-associated protein Csf2